MLMARVEVAMDKQEIAQRLVIVMSGKKRYTHTLVIQPDSNTGLDAYLYSTDPSSNNSTKTWLTVGERTDASGIYRSVIKFDLALIPSNAVITSAVLSLYCTTDLASSPSRYSLYKLKRAWVPAEVSWSLWKSSSAWSMPGAFGTDDCEQIEIGGRNFSATETINQFKDFVLTPTTKAGLDLGNGWLIKSDTELDCAYQFVSCNDPTEATRPKLTITWTDTNP